MVKLSHFDIGKARVPVMESTMLISHETLVLELFVDLYKKFKNFFFKLKFKNQHS